MGSSGSAPMREERRAVTALFADLVGSTGLGERLDPEEARLVVGEALSRMVRAVEDFGGTVKDLAGDGVLALFGAPVAHEDDAERAVRAGLRIVEDVASYGEEVGAAYAVAPLAVRVGVNTGPVVLGPVGAGSRVEYGATGDAVNVASRLQTHAEPGTVLVGSNTRRLADASFDWDEPRAFQLKGRERSVEASAALAARMPGGRVRRLEGVRARLVGRDRELDQARHAVEAVMAGTGGILFVTGEPGIGKSRLVAEVHELAARLPSERPLTWLEGRCVSYGEALPYWPFRDLLRGFLGVALDEPELRVRVTLRRAMERLIHERAADPYPYLGAMLGLTLEPDAAARLAPLSPEALQYRTFEVVEQLLRRLADDSPVVVALEDVHWADPTSVQLLERLLAATEDAALLLLVTQRPERDHPSWAIKELAARELPHRTREVRLEALTGRTDVELLHALVGPTTLPADIEDRLLRHAEGNPFYLEELVAALADAGALVREDGGWRFDHEVEIEVPPTVEKVVLARLDRLEPGSHRVLTSASVLGRQFGLPLLQAVVGDQDASEALTDLQRLDLVRQERRWPQPEYRFKHVLIQETVYRTLLARERRRLHATAARWLEEQASEGETEAAGLLAHHWQAAADEDKAVRYLTLAADRARQEYALDEAIEHYRTLLPLMERRGEAREVALVLFKLALALHTTLRFRDAHETYHRAFDLWTPPDPPAEPPAATLRVSTSFLPNDNDPRSAIAWPNIQLCMQLFDRLVEAWPERTLVPSLAHRWEIAEDGLRYVFHLREGLRWSDGEALTARDIEFGIKRVLNPQAPGSSVAIYFALENGQDYYLGRNRDADRIGVRAVDDHTVEFRLVAPAPYFMSVMNRPDAGPQPEHAIEVLGDAWREPARQVVSGPFRIAEWSERVTLERHDGDAHARPGNVRRLEYVQMPIEDAAEPYRRDQLDMITLRYTPRMADLTGTLPEAPALGPATWSFYLTFDHAHPATSNLDLRRALAHALDREALGAALTPNLVPATGGLVPPALQGHTPDITLPFDPDLARDLMERSGVQGPIRVGGYTLWEPIIGAVVDSWERVLGPRFVADCWEAREIQTLARPWEHWQVFLSGWLPGYPDPEYYLRLLLHSESRTNEGGFAHPPFDELIERARQERSDRRRLELFHQADRMAVAERAALIPVAYGRSMSFVKPWVAGWWEFGKSCASFADLTVDERSPRSEG